MKIVNWLPSFCSCGHLYHSFCLQSKECTIEIEGQTRWTCYKCSSSNKAGKLSENSSEVKKGRITPSQVKLVFMSRWSRKWQPTSVFLPGEFHGQRSLEGYTLWGCQE